MKKRPGRPEKPAAERAKNFTLRFPLPAMLKIQAMAVEEGFVTKNGNPKVPAFIMSRCGVHSSE